MQLANNARTILASGINNSTQTIPLSDASLFPTVTATVLTGTVTSTGGNAFSVTGSGTLFTSELAVGDVVTWTGIEWRRVVQIVSNTVMILDRETTVSGVTMTKRDAYYITVSNASGATIERMLVLATSGNTFTCARAQDSSSAAAFSAGAAVEYRITAGFVRQIIADAVVGALKNLAETHGADLIGLSATGVTATVVSDALEEVAASVAGHIADSSAAHAASAISFTPASGIAATDVQAAVVEAKTDAAAGLSGHEAATPGAHAATAISFSPGSGLSSTNVQDAVEEAAVLVSGVAGALDQIADIVDTSNEGPYDDAVPAQLSRGISAYVAGADYWTCSGSGTTFALAAPGNDNLLRKPTAYFDGMQVRFFANAENTGAASVNVAGLGAIQVLDKSSAVYAKWRDNELVTLTYLAGDFYKDSPEDGAVLYSFAETTPGPDTWTKPAGYSRDDTVQFRAVAGAGSGGVALNGAAAVYAAGGEGGSAVWFTCRYSDCPATVDFDIGAGGAGNTLGANGATVGNAGGDTTMDFGTFVLTANGGAGGDADVAAAATTPNAGWLLETTERTTTDWSGGNGGDGDTVPLDGSTAVHGGGGGGGATTLDGTSSTAANGGISMYAGAGGPSDAQHTAVAAVGQSGAAPGGGGGAATARVAAAGATSGDGANGEFAVRILRGWHPYGLTRGY